MPRTDVTREWVKGIFVFKTGGDRTEGVQLVQDLGCRVILDNPQRITIEATRDRLKHLKARHLSDQDDTSEISSRLRQHFERIVIGGTSRA